MACLCITKQHVNWLPTMYNCSNWEWPLYSAHNCLCAHLISPTRGDVLSVSPWTPWSWTRVHAPQVCRTQSERRRINIRDPCSSLKSSPPPGLNPFSSNSTIRKEMWMNARWSNIPECNPSIRGKYLKIKTPFTQKSFFTVVFCLEDLLLKVLGKYSQCWKMEKTHYLPENPYLYW